MRKQWLSLIAFLVLCLGVIDYAGADKKVIAKKDIKEKSKQEEKIAADLGDFSYTSEGKRDPFQAVLIMKAKAAGSEVKSHKIAKKAKEDALEYELEALKLVGVLKSDRGMIAMMEDTQGKGVFFRKTDHLNKNMWVDDITSKDVTLAYKLKGETKKVVVNIPEKK